MDEDGITDIDEIDPANSTTESVMEFMERFKDDQEMLDGQFNPFIKESTPPVIINVKVKTHERWETVWVGFIPVPTLKRAWAEIDVEVIDVAKFYVTVKISPGRTAQFEGEGHEWFKAELDIHFLELVGKYKVRIEMEDFAGNSLDPPFEKEMDGLFGGVLRMLEDLWDFICAVVSAIAEAVTEALSFLVDIIVGIIKEALDTLLAPVVNSIIDFRTSIHSWINDAMFEYEKTGKVSVGTMDFLHNIMNGPPPTFTVALILGLAVVASIVSVMTAGLGLIISFITGLVVDLLLMALLGLVASFASELDIISYLVNSDISGFLNEGLPILLAPLEGKVETQSWVGDALGGLGLIVSIASTILAAGGFAVLLGVLIVHRAGPPGGLKDWILDIAGLALATIGVIISVGSDLWVSMVGMILSGVGLWLTYIGTHPVGIIENWASKFAWVDFGVSAASTIATGLKL